MTSQLNALIDLLDDPDEKVYVQIKGELMTYGEEIIPMLENTWENTLNKLIQERIEYLIHDIQFNDLLSSFEKHFKASNPELLKASLLIAKYQYPDLDEDLVYNQLEKIKKIIWLELNDNLTALEKVSVINRILFTTLGFKGNLKNITSPTNYYINEVLESKKGNSVTLCILYMTIAQELGLPIYGVNLPENFILGYRDESGLLESKDEIGSDVMFYIDPFSKGVVFPQKQIIEFLNHIKLEPQESYFEICSTKTVIKRMLMGLIESYKKLDKTDKAEELSMFLDILNRNK
ncbi:MAG: hypothetical protein HRT72_08895 [Flavobacteriales bacterium]|nr:hypothetical protein [Flavobacteriales bacterium]